MNEALLEIVRVQEHLARIQELMYYGLLFMAFLDFLGLVMSTWALHLVRVSRAEARTDRDEMARILERIDRRAERQNFYLFSKLGPAETK